MLPWTKWRRLGGERHSDDFDWDGPACYELGVGRSASPVRRKYVGHTINEKRRMSEYAIRGSHLQSLIWKYLMNGNHLYYRAIALSEYQAKKMEKKQLETYHYEWNKLNNSDPFKQFLGLTHDRTPKIRNITLNIS
jgi:hypothetical protein